MRYGRFRAHNVGPFTDVDIDLDAIPGKAVAVWGPNGSGKSTLLELMTGGTSYRKCANRGRILDLATSATSFIETSLTNGASYTIRHDLDAVASVGKCKVADSAGVEQLEDPSVTRFDEWAAIHLPDPKVLYASTVSPQESVGLLKMKPADRMAVILRAIGCEQYEAQAKQARKYAEDATKEIETASVKVATERARVRICAADLASTLEAEKTAQFSATGAVTVASDTLLWRRGEHQRATEHNESIAKRTAAIGKAEADVGHTYRTLDDLDARMATRRATLARKDEVRAAEAKAKELDAQLVAAREALATKVAQRRAAVDQVDQLDASVRRAEQREQQALEGILSAERHLGRRAEIEQAVRDVERLTGEADRLKAASVKANEEHASLSSSHLASVEERIVGLREAMTTIREGGEDPHWAPGVARDALQADDDAVKLAKELPGQIEIARKATWAHGHAHDHVRAELAMARETAALAPSLADAEAALARAQLAATERAEEVRAATESRKVARERHDALEADGGDIAVQCDALAGQIRALAPLVNLAPGIANAEASLAELEIQHAEALAMHEQARRNYALASEVLLPQPLPIPDVEAAERALRAAEKALADGKTRMALLDREHLQAVEAEGRIAALEKEIAGARERQADWTRTASDIDGVKLFDIDAVGPELTELANDLLHTCVGPRWTLKIETQRANAKGDKMLDGCAVWVIDSGSEDSPAREGPGESFSPGQRVMLNESVHLALAMRQCRRSGIQGATLIRDETGSALDPENAQAHMAMFRRAVEIVGASKIVFVTHSKDVLDLADDVITVGGGTAIVGAPGAAEEAA